MFFFLLQLQDRAVALHHPFVHQETDLGNPLVYYRSPDLPVPDGHWEAAYFTLIKQHNIKERHPGVKRMALEVPDAGPISNTAGAHADLLKYYGLLTQQIFFTYHWINKTLFCACCSPLSASCCSQCIAVVAVIIGATNDRNGQQCLLLRFCVISIIKIC